MCGLVLSAGLPFILRPAVVKTENHSRLLVLLRWQSGEIRFINSVTERPVRISFRIADRFRDFAAVTDETTEAYYTGGMYCMNKVLSKSATGVLRFCSIEGIHLSLGFYSLDVKNGCLEVRFLWTM
jgi:hypothetical protein